MEADQPMRFSLLLAFSGLLLFCSTSAATGEQRLSRIGVVYPGPHPLVKDVLTGLRSGLQDEGLTEGQGYLLIEKHAAGDPANFTSVCQAIIGAGVDVLVPISTPIAQAAVKENDGRLPIVFIAVTDPIGAKLLKDPQQPGNNLTGVSDAWPYRQQLELLKQILPQSRTIGVMYNPAEENSVYGISQIRPIAKNLGLAVVDGTVTGPSEISSRANSLIVLDHVDAIFLSSDNTLLGAAEAAIKAGDDHKTPVFSGDSGTVKRGALASVSIGYIAVGRQAATLIAKVLRGKPAGRIPIVTATGSDVYLNLDAARRTGVSIPSAIISRAKEVYGAPAPKQELQTLKTSTLIVLACGAGLVLLLIIIRRKTQRVIESP